MQNIFEAGFLSKLFFLKKKIRQKAQKEAAKRAGAGSQLGARAAGLTVIYK